MNRDEILAWQKDLIEAFGVNTSRRPSVLEDLFIHERLAGERFSKEVIGHRLLTDAFFTFYAETLIAISQYTGKRGWPSTYANYGPVVLMYQTAFRTLRAAEVVSHSGYFYQAYSQLRSVKDQALALGAVANKQTTLGELFGWVVYHEAKQLGDDVAPDQREVVRRRMAAEKMAEDFIFGKNSGLSADAVSEMTRWNQMFNWESHRGLMTYFRETELLADANVEYSFSLHPSYDEAAVGMFVNRSNEVSWMIHRVMPFLQTTDMKFNNTWISRWELLDRSFRMMLESLER
ncbi:MAG: hypothetical protein KF769_06460, partial [Parvibaculum sp.]|nr:hypothetical protein [Parvibaculum sp.]